MKNLLQSKYIITELLQKSEVLLNLRQCDKRNAFLAIIIDSSFWEAVNILCEILQFPTNLIGKFESDSCHIGTVYINFRRMLTHFEKSAYPELLTEIVNERWAFIHSD